MDWTKRDCSQRKFVQINFTKTINDKYQNNPYPLPFNCNSIEYSTSSGGREDKSVLFSRFYDSGINFFCHFHEFFHLFFRSFDFSRVFSDYITFLFTNFRQLNVCNVWPNVEAFHYGFALFFSQNCRRKTLPNLFFTRRAKEPSKAV